MGRYSVICRAPESGIAMGISYKEETVLDLIARAYDAALGPERWPEFLASLAEAVGAASAAFYLHDGGTDKIGFNYYFGFKPAFITSYARHMASVDPWLAAAKSLPEGSVFTGQSLVPNRSLEHTEFYDKWLRPQNAYHGLGAIVRKEGKTSSQLILVRSKSAGPFRPTARTFLRKLVPQLRRALIIHEQFATLDLTRVAFGDTLDCLEVGVVLIDPQGRPYFMNRRAEALAGLRDGLVLNGAEIAAASAKETAELRELVSRARVGDRGGDPGGSMTISRPSQKRPYSVLVTPIRVGDLDYAVDAGPARPVAAVFISDPEHQIALDEADVANHYGLTLAEAAVLVGLANGFSLREIAADRGISKNTVRSHLQRVFDKTDTSRQAELVKLVLSGPAAVGATAGDGTSKD